MSKLADAIRRSQRIEAAPMGFGAPKTAAKATMLVAALVASGDVEKARGAGADLIVSRGKAPAVTNGAPVGVLAGDLTASTAKELADAGVDFVVLEAKNSEAAALLEERLGFVVKVDDDPDVDDLRALESLNLDGLMLEKTPASLTLERQLRIARASALARKPLLCPVDADISKEDLQALRSVGVAVIVSEDASAIAALKERVLGLPARKLRREERPAVALPRGAPPNRDEDEDD